MRVLHSASGRADIGLVHVGLVRQRLPRQALGMTMRRRLHANTSRISMLDKKGVGSDPEFRLNRTGRAGATSDSNPKDGEIVHKMPLAVIKPNQVVISSRTSNV